MPEWPIQLTWQTGSDKEGRVHTDWRYEDEERPRMCVYCDEGHPKKPAPSARSG